MPTSPTKFWNERRQRPDAFATDALPSSAVKLVAEYTVNTCTHDRFQNFAVFFAPLDLRMEQEENTHNAAEKDHSRIRCHSAHINPFRNG